jgi:DNA-binding transcriptional ArsR family regulator
MNHHEASSRTILACLGDSSRFRIVLSLMEHERCVTELASEIGLSQSCTTRHLQYLEREGLVRGDRQGKRVMFRLRSDRARVRELMAWVTATPPDPAAGRTSGADLHVESTGRPRSPAGAGRTRQAKPPAPGRAAPPPVPPAQLATRPEAPSREDALPAHRAETQDPGDATAGRSAQDGNDMEDWLL